MKSLLFIVIIIEIIDLIDKMKYTSLAVLALLSFVSAEEIAKKKIVPYIDDHGYVVMKQELG